MNKRFSFVSVLFTVVCMIACKPEKASDLDFSGNYDPHKVGERLSERFLSTNHMLNENNIIHYAEVCTWYGALRYAEAVGDKDLISKLEARFTPFFEGEKDYLPWKNHVDLNMFGCLPLEFYKITNDRKYLDLGLPYADTQWDLPEKLTKEEQAYYDSGLSWQTRLWIDDMFMITIIQSKAYQVTGDRKYIDRAAKEMVVYLKELQRPNGLFYHAPDVPFYWARGNGWMAAGMTELLRYLPEDNSDRPEIMKGYLTMMNSLKKYQSATGTWNQLIDEPSFWPETSGSAMFAYAMITGVRHGWLDVQEFTGVARKAWSALVPYINENNDVTEVCVGTNKRNDKQYYYDRPRIDGDFHGQAPYLWCVYALLEKI